MAEVDCDTPIWATVEQFVALHPEVNEDDALEALIEATWLLSGLVNDRYHQAECREDHYQYRRGLCRIELAHQPVDTVFEVVKLDPDTGEETAIDGWKKMAGGSVRICCRGGNSLYYFPYGHDPLLPCDPIPCGNCDDHVIVVRYRTKDNLPPGCARQVMKLAYEFWKSSNGKACSLPERITNVTREGVSWTLLDPLDFLDKGLTGIGSIDLWISRVNGKGWAGLIDPLMRPRLMLSELTSCGAACTGIEA